jgi:tetratricopeptide (TPR) repeat protein
VFREYDPDPRLDLIADLIDNDECEEALGRLEDLEPELTDPEALGASIGLRMVCLLAEEREEEAQALIDELLAEHGDDPDTILAAGIECSEHGEYRVAERLFRFCYEKEPDPGAAYNLGVALQRDERHEEALAWLDTAAAKGADFAALHRSRAYSLDQLERLDEASASWKSYLELEPGDSDGWTHLAIDESDLGDSQRALADFGKAVSLDPENTMAWYNCAITASRIGDRARLETCAAALHEMERDGWRALMTAMRLAEFDGEGQRAWELACDAIDRAVLLSDEDEASATLPHVLQTVIGLTETLNIPEERAKLLERALDLGLFYPPVFDALRADLGRDSARAALYYVLVEGWVSEPELLAELREEDGVRDGEYRYAVAYRTWAENIEDAEAKVLEFEKAHGPGAELQIAESKCVGGPEPTKCGIAWRGHMHVFLEQED